MKKLLFALLVIGLSGCESMKQPEYVWKKPGSTYDDFNMDTAQCKAQAAGVAGMVLMQVVIVYSNCMAGKGWYQVEKPK